MRTSGLGSLRGYTLPRHSGSGHRHPGEGPVRHRDVCCGREIRGGVAPVAWLWFLFFTRLFGLGRVEELAGLFCASMLFGKPFCHRVDGGFQRTPFVFVEGSVARLVDQRVKLGTSTSTRRRFTAVAPFPA